MTCQIKYREIIHSKPKVMDFSWQKASHALVRELGWSLFSPPIAHFGATASDPLWQPALDEEARHLLAVAEADSTPLAKHLDALNDRRLGARFEAFWQFFLSHHSFYQVLAANLQIVDNGQTLGAIDFLIHDHYLDKVVHLELAVKFYLYSPGGVSRGGLADWIGPNPDDDLAKKITHLKARQLPLTTSTITGAVLKQKGLPPPDIRVALIRGYLFSPLTTRIIPGPMVDPDHLQGRWLHAWQLTRLDSVRTRTTFDVLTKDSWLDPNPGVGQSFAMARRQVLDLLAHTGEPVLVAARKRNQEGAASRYFVVPDGWPGPARAAVHHLEAQGET